ncbi:uncharacterized protein TNCV_4960841 [Trichonephila clavipes]|uniref:Uncharacterized protein n=1 Tax=Trichonephila clavipes TaxID=2585209 RepID=A0A8X6VI88_TRICX|nr:uncharacterized protein TNCV_4960841 [Trichonephila clavipes]
MLKDKANDRHRNLALRHDEFRGHRSYVTVDQNDIPIDVACHRYTLNMQVSSGTKNISSPNEPSCTTVTVSFNGVLLVVTGAWRSPY